MLLDVEEAVFDTADHQPVITLLGMVAERRHDWQPALAQAIRADDFVKRLAAAEIRLPVLAEWLRQAVVEATNPAPVEARRKVPIGPDDLAHTVADLARPAVVLVENELGDGGFVRAAAAALGDERIVDALCRMPRWLVFSHGGGKDQMPRLAQARCAEFSVIVRVAVLFDSDRSTPDADGNADKVRAAHDAGVPHVHMWAWRMMENYIPFRVWEEHFSTKADTLQRVRQTVPAQRGYLNLKHEFVGRKGRMPADLIRDDLALTEDDFHQLGPDVVPELRAFLAMIHEIL